MTLHNYLGLSQSNITHILLFILNIGESQLRARTVIDFAHILNLLLNVGHMSGAIWEFGADDNLSDHHRELGLHK